MITPNNKWSQRLLNICFIVLIVYFGIACIGKIHEVYTSIITIHNLQKRIGELERRRSKSQNIRGLSLCGQSRARDDGAI